MVTQLGVDFRFFYADYGLYDFFSPNPSLQHFFENLNPQILIHPEVAHTVLTPYYYSIVTFTTLGFGNLVPLNLSAQIAIAVEVLFGYIMLGGLISILANKLARRA